MYDVLEGFLLFFLGIYLVFLVTTAKEDQLI